MATQNIISYLRLLVFISLSIQVDAQTKILHYDEGFIHVGDDSVIYYDQRGEKYTTDPTHEYFEKYSIDAPDQEHMQHLQNEIKKLNDINEGIKNLYIDNEKYINTNDTGTRNTRSMLQKQHSYREFIIIQYTNTLKKIESRIPQ